VEGMYLTIKNDSVTVHVEYCPQFVQRVFLSDALKLTQKSTERTFQTWSYSRSLFRIVIEHWTYNSRRGRCLRCYPTTDDIATGEFYTGRCNSTPTPTHVIHELMYTNVMCVGMSGVRKKMLVKKLTH